MADTNDRQRRPARGGSTNIYDAHDLPRPEHPPTAPAADSDQPMVSSVEPPKQEDVPQT